jgi:DNA-binding XRE family transcriptional regulator
MASNFSAYMLQLRHCRGLTQSEFAKQIHASRTFVWDMENDKRCISVHKANEFCKNLGINSRELIQVALQNILDRDNLKFTVTVREQK